MRARWAWAWCLERLYFREVAILALSMNQKSSSIFAVPRRHSAALMVALSAVCWPFLASAEIYIYTDTFGKRVVSDRPLQVAGYRLQHRRANADDVGYLLSGKMDEINNRRRQLYDSYIKTASRTYRLDPALIKAVIHVESDFNPMAVSPKGARGLMQLMPKTAAQYQERDLFNPMANINVGARHLAVLVERYPHDLRLALAAYNAGEHSVDRYQGVPPFRETRDYVKKVLKYRDRYRSVASL